VLHPVGQAIPDNANVVSFIERKGLGGRCDRQNDKRHESDQSFHELSANRLS